MSVMDVQPGKWYVNSQGFGVLIVRKHPKHELMHGLTIYPHKVGQMMVTEWSAAGQRYSGHRLTTELVREATPDEVAKLQAGQSIGRVVFE